MRISARNIPIPGIRAKISAKPPPGSLGKQRKSSHYVSLDPIRRRNRQRRNTELLEELAVRPVLDHLSQDFVWVVHVSLGALVHHLKSKLHHYQNAGRFRQSYYRRVCAPVQN